MENKKIFAENISLFSPWLTDLFPDPLNPSSQTISHVTIVISHYLFYYTSKVVKLS